MLTYTARLSGYKLPPPLDPYLAQVMEVKKIDVSPHAPFGSKAARKVAKDRASERYL